MPEEIKKTKRIGLEGADFSLDLDGVIVIDGISFRIDVAGTETGTTQINGNYLDFSIRIRIVRNYADHKPRVSCELRVPLRQRYGSTTWSYLDTVELWPKYNGATGIKVFVLQLKRRIDEYDKIMSSKELKLKGLVFKPKDRDLYELHAKIGNGGIMVRLGFKSADVVTSDNRSSVAVEMPLSDSIDKCLSLALGRMKIGPKANREDVKTLIYLDDAMPRLEDRYFRKSSMLSPTEVKNFQSDLKAIVRKYGFKVESTKRDKDED